MAHPPLRPIGQPKDDYIDSEGFREAAEAHRERNARLRDKRAEVHAGWGEKYTARVHEKGKLTARERLEQLKDPNAPVFEVGTFVNDGEVFGGKLRSPGAGVVTAFTQVHGRWCMVIANDNTVASGSWWPRTPEKIERAQEMALRLRIPTLYLVDCSGLFLPEQSRSFPGAKGAGHIFKMNSLLSAAGVPQIAGVFGDCIAGGGYMPIISDRVYMTEQAYMVIAGAALIKGAKSQKLTSLSIGGPEVHVHQSGCADVRVPSDEVLIDCIRRDVAKLPSSAASYYEAPGGALRPNFEADEIEGLLPVDHREVYSAEAILSRLVDASLFWELMPEVGTEMLCGVGRFGGLYAGVIMNRQGLVDDPSQPGKKRPAGVLYRDGIAKISAFSRACNDDGLPILWLQDISGFDIGQEAERLGLLGYGSSLIYTNSTNQTPMFTVLLRKASGAGYYAMSGLPYDPVIQLSTTVSRLSVMEGRTLSIATYNTKLDDNFEIVTTDPAEREEIEKGMREVEARIESDMDPFVAARQMDTDEIIAPREIRDWLVAAVAMSYQNTGSRRIKNPRIWSLHDLAALYNGSSRAAAPHSEASLDSSGSSADASSRSEIEKSKEQNVYRAPSSGRFYTRPSPDKPAFLKEGDAIKPGQAVGLLEVMKTFNRVLYDGPEGVKLEAFLVEDGADVDEGDPLFRYKR